MSGGTAVFVNSGSATPRIGRLLANLQCQPDCHALSSCVALIWRQLLDALAKPITVTQFDCGRTVTFMGAMRFCIAREAGTVQVAELAIQDGLVAFHPTSNVGIDLPARLDGAWLDAFLMPFQRQMTDSLADGDRQQFGVRLQAVVRRELVRCLEQRTHWRRLRHALRDALGLDRHLLSAIRQGRHRLVRFCVTELQYNRAVANRNHYRQIQSENPNLLWLYNLIDELGIVLPAGDIIAAFKDKLMAESGLTGATWRYLSRCDYRHFRHVIDFVGLDGETHHRWPELLHWLRWTTVLGCRVPISPAIMRMFEHDTYEAKEGGRIVCFRAVDLQTGTMRAILKEAEARHAAGTLARFIDGDLVEVMTWLQVERPALDANQVRRGWRYLVSRADSWRAALACGPVLAAVKWDSFMACRIHGAWTVMPVTDAWNLRREALTMRHCADSYLPKCVDGSYRIFSVRNENGKRVATIGITLKSGCWRTSQVCGFANNAVSVALQAVADDTAARYDALYRIVGTPVDVDAPVVPDGRLPARSMNDDLVIDPEDDESGESGEEEIAWGMEESACPICAVAHDDQPCRHAVLTYDRTFSEICGGALYGEFDDIVDGVEAEIRHACQRGYWRIEVDEIVASLSAQIGPWTDPESFDTAFLDMICEHRRAFREMILDQLSDHCQLVTMTSWYFDQGGSGMVSAYYSSWGKKPEVVALWLRYELRRQID